MFIFLQMQMITNADTSMFIGAPIQKQSIAHTMTKAYI